MAHAMLSQTDLPLNFWGKAVDTVVHIINHLPTKVVAEMTTEKTFTGHKPSVSQLYVFGLDAYVHISYTMQSKFESKSKKCKFLGYISHSRHIDNGSSN